MDKDNKNNNLAEMNEIFNNKTLSYRINGFAYACNMNDLNVPDNKTIKDDKVYYGYNQVLFNTKKDSTAYYIVVNPSDNKSYANGITISGYYNDLNFSFTNFYSLKENLNRNILELPFDISLYKNIDNDTYHLQIKTTNGIETKFTITKSREYKDKTISSNVNFYANVLDFSKVLKLIKSFVYNPKLVFTTYNEILHKKKIAINNGDLNKGLMQDNNLDKPTCKIKSIVKKIIGN